MASILPFSERRAAQLSNEARREILIARRGKELELADKLERIYASRIRLLLGEDAMRAFWRECRAREKIGDARRCFLSCFEAEDPVETRKIALDYWNQGRAELAAVLKVPESSVEFSDGY